MGYYIDQDQLKEELLISKKEGLTDNAKAMFKQMAKNKLCKYDFKEEWIPVIEEAVIKDMERLWVNYNPEKSLWPFAYMSTIIGCSIARIYTKLHKESKTNIIKI